MTVFLTGGGQGSTGAAHYVCVCVFLFVYVDL